MAPAALRRSAYEPVPAPSDSSAQQHTLTLLSWNVLADGLAQTGRWAHCPPHLLGWAARAPALLAEVDAAAADVVCLQECNHFADFWCGEMKDRGYDGAFWAKPGSPAARAGAPPDGCAIFWRAGRFTATAICGEPFNARCAAPGTKTREDGGPPSDTGATDEEANGGGRAAPSSSATASGDALPAPTPPRGVQGCLVVTLDDALSGRAVVVACTHLKAKSGEEEEAVRGRQAAEAVARLREAAAAVSAVAVPAAADAPRPPPPPVMLLAGDFNAGPASPAAAAPLSAGLASVWEVGEGGGTLAPTKWEWSTYKWRTAGVGGTAAASAGEHDGADAATPPKASRGLVDHVFYRGAVLAARWPPLDEGAATDGLPCAGYPSDHVAVAAVFRV